MPSYKAVVLFLERIPNQHREDGVGGGQYWCSTATAHPDLVTPSNHVFGYISILVTVVFLFQGLGSGKFMHKVFHPSHKA